MNPAQVWTDWASLALAVIAPAAVLLATRAVFLAVFGWWLGD